MRGNRMTRGISGVAPRRAARLVVALGLCILGVGVATVSLDAQDRNNALRGTWSGNWQPEAGYTAVTVRFESNGDKLVGEILNPAQVAFTRLDFDEENLTVVAEAKDEKGELFKLEARIEETTHLNGTLTRTDAAGAMDSGEMKLTKWTYRPSLR